jgi:glycosyltransferase involved in cell wall biosynthesis
MRTLQGASSQVSVVLSVYNGEKYLAPAIDSVLHQTHNNLELILVNDGSVDCSLQIMKAYRDSRIKIIDLKENQGLVAALNIGIAAAQGDYVARMDSDDIACPDRLEQQLRFLNCNDVDVCGSAITLFGVGREREVSFPEGDTDIKFRLLYSSSLAHPTVMGRRDCFSTYAYRKDFPVSEDYDLWTRMSQAGIRFGNIAKPLLRYRVHPNQISVKKRLQQLREGAEIAASFKLGHERWSNVAAALAGVSFGFCESINFEDFVKLVDAIDADVDKGISDAAAKDLLLYLYRKISPMNPITGWKAKRLLSESSVRLSRSEEASMMAQALMFAHRESAVFRFLRTVRG